MFEWPTVPTECFNAARRRQTDAFLGYAPFLAELGGTSLLTYRLLDGLIWLKQCH